MYFRYSVFSPVFLGSISAALSCPVYVPPREETAGRVSGKACLWRNFIMFSCGAWGGRKYHLMTIIGWPTWRLRLVKFVVFSPLLLTLALQPILFHIIVAEGHYMLYSIEEFCFVLFFFFASSVCFGWFKNLILSGFAGDWCCFSSRRLRYTSIWLSILFLEIDVCVYPSLCLLCSLSHILAPHDSNIDSNV